MTVSGQLGGGQYQATQPRAATRESNLSTFSQSVDTSGQSQVGKRQLFSYFGQNEIRGLISLSFYAFYCQSDFMQAVDKQVLERISKLVIILIKEVVQRF